MTPAEELPPILARFGLVDVTVRPVEGGHINRSWKIVPRSPLPASEPDRGPRRGTGSFLLQRINPQVFRNGELVLQNVAAVCDHLGKSALRLELDQPERRVMRLVRASNGLPGVKADDGAWWRLLGYIEDADAHQRAESPDMAREAGRAYGLFQRLLADYNGPTLAETIPGFHDTRLRIDRLGEALRRDTVGRAGSVASELRQAISRTPYADVLPPLIASGELPNRVVHNDAKIGNVLFDREDGRSLAVVDLDTVMPGTLLSDVGDLIRSLASPTDEDERDRSKITVSPPLVEALMTGLMEQWGRMLTTAERELLVFSGILLTYEQGVRFLTDYLDGDRYYRIARPTQNLDRARAQFQLLSQLESERAPLERTVARIAGRQS